MLRLLKGPSSLFQRRPASSAEKSNKQLLLESGFFDVKYYRETYDAELAASGLDDPILHYLRIGGLKGFHPSPKFNGALYLSHYPEVRTAKFNPLLHYLRHGRHEGRAIHPVIKSAQGPVAPNAAQWKQLTALIKARSFPPPVIDVVVPVYRGFAETANCIFTAVRSKLDCGVSFDIIAVDDASPEPELSKLLDQLAADKLITLVRHPTNLGFVKGVNEGMKVHNDRDVILLNSDTEVFGNWVDRLHRAAYAERDIGTVTPFSNNATICSYPNFPGEFKGALELSFAELDQLASQVNAGEIVDILTGVGFCMYVRRDCLQKVGLFDEEAFGLGYGEENDFSLRASSMGWRNVLAGDVFVRHLGRVSFLDSTEERVKRGLEIIKKRYPSFLTDVAAHIKSDPAKRLRRNLDIGRLRRVTGDRTVLFALHTLGGGTAKHVRDMTRLLEAEGIGVLWLQPKGNPSHTVSLINRKVRHLSSGTEIDLRYGLRDTAELLSALNLAHIHVHHTLGFSPEFTEWIKRIAALCHVEYDVTIHDYFLACPRITMIDESGQYCGNFDFDRCEICIQGNGSPAGHVSVWDWRARNGAFLAGARRIFIPHEAVQNYMAPFYPGVTFTVREHPEAEPSHLGTAVARHAGERLRIAVIGAIGAHKGSKVLEGCAIDAVNRDLPIDFHIFGYTDIAALRALPNVKMTGEYKEDALSDLITQARCHMAFFPAVWPETYSYTLSQAWFAGLWPVAIGLGAIAERIKRAGWGHLLPLEMASNPAEINDTLLALDPPPQPENFRPAGRAAYRSIWTDYYELREPAVKSCA